MHILNLLMQRLRRLCMQCCQSAQKPACLQEVDRLPLQLDWHMKLDVCIRLCVDRWQLH